MSNEVLEMLSLFGVSLPGISFSFSCLKFIGRCLILDEPDAFTAYFVPGRNMSSSQAIPFRLHDRKQKANKINDSAINPGPEVH